MNGWPTTPSRPQKLEVILRSDGTFLDWRCARGTTFALWGFRTEKSMRHSTMSRFTPPGNELEPIAKSSVHSSSEQKVGRPADATPKTDSSLGEFFRSSLSPPASASRSWLQGDRRGSSRTDAEARPNPRSATPLGAHSQQQSRT